MTAKGTTVLVKCLFIYLLGGGSVRGKVLHIGKNIKICLLGKIYFSVFPSLV